MNKVILIGRPTGDPEVRYTGDSMAIARYTLAVDRRFKRDGEPEADFIKCVAFGKQGEFAEKHVKKGVRIAISGRIQTGSYEKDGQKVYTTDIVVEEHDFADGKSGSNNSGSGSSGGFSSGSNSSGDGFMNIPDGIDEELPFN